MPTGVALTIPSAPATGQRLGAEAERLQVGQLVEIADALGGALDLVQGRGAGGLDAGADQADEAGRLGVWRHAGGFPPVDFVWVLTGILSHLPRLRGRIPSMSRGSVQALGRTRGGGRRRAGCRPVRRGPSRGGAAFFRGSVDAAVARAKILVSIFVRFVPD